MSVLLQIGIAYPNELSEGIGHVACTLGGVNYESRGGKGCLRGSHARGATNKLFRHQFFLLIPKAEATTAHNYAEDCVGQPYVWDRVPTSKNGGDCSGFVSGIICFARGGSSPKRVFSTGTWKSVRDDLGFKSGLGGGVIATAQPAGVADRPYPGHQIKENSTEAGHVKWIQARLNFAASNHHAVLGGDALDVDGEFGPLTEKVLVAFQKSKGGEGLGVVGPKTWAWLNAVR